MAVKETMRFTQSTNRRALYGEAAEMMSYTLRALTALWLATMEMTTYSLMVAPTVVCMEAKGMMF